MINSLLKVTLCLGISTGTIIQNESVSMQNVQKDEDVFTKYDKQDEVLKKKYKIDAQGILGNSLQLLNNSKAALVQITNKLNDITNQGAQVNKSVAEKILNQAQQIIAEFKSNDKDIKNRLVKILMQIDRNQKKANELIEELPKLKDNNNDFIPRKSKIENKMN